MIDAETEGLAACYAVTMKIARELGRKAAREDYHRSGHQQDLPATYSRAGAPQPNVQSYVTSRKGLTQNSG